MRMSQYYKPENGKVQLNLRIISRLDIEFGMWYTPSKINLLFLKMVEGLNKFFEANGRFKLAVGYIDWNDSATRAGAANTISSLALGVLFVMGCVAAAQMSGGTVIGWTGVGVGAGTVILQLCGGKFSKMARKVDLLVTTLFAAAIITIGALGAAGMISGFHTGVALLGIAGGELLLYTLARFKYMEKKVEWGNYDRI